MPGLELSSLSALQELSAPAPAPVSAGGALPAGPGFPVLAANGLMSTVALARLAVPGRVSPEDLRAFEAALAAEEGASTPVTSAGPLSSTGSVGDMTATLRARWEPTAQPEPRPLPLASTTGPGPSVEVQREGGVQAHPQPLQAQPQAVVQAQPQAQAAQAQPAVQPVATAPVKAQPEAVVPVQVQPAQVQPQNVQAQPQILVPAQPQVAQAQTQPQVQIAQAQPAVRPVATAPVKAQPEAVVQVPAQPAQVQPQVLQAQPQVVQAQPQVTVQTQPLTWATAQPQVAQAQTQPQVQVAQAQPAVQPSAMAPVKAQPEAIVQVQAQPALVQQQVVQAQPQIVHAGSQPFQAQPQILVPAQPQVQIAQPQPQVQVTQVQPAVQPVALGEVPTAPQTATKPAVQPPVEAQVKTQVETQPAALVQPALPSSVQASKPRQMSDAEEADEAVTSSEATVPRSPWETLTAMPPVQATVMPAVVVQAASVAAPQGPAADRFEVAQIVQQVTRTLAWRDLDALQAGREVVLHLDEALMPQTVLTFRPAVAGPGAAADGLGAEVVVSLQTQSTEVREFLDTHGQALVEAMARQAPGLRWAPTPELAWQGTAPVVTPSLTTDTAFSRPANVLTQAADSNAARTGRTELTVTDPTLRTGDTLQVASTTSSGAAGQQAWQGDDGAASSGRGQGSSGQQERDPSQGQSSSQGQGQQGQGQGQGQGFSTGANDRADTDAAVRWSSQSEAARTQAAAAFADAVDAQAD